MSWFRKRYLTSAPSRPDLLGEIPSHPKVLVHQPREPPLKASGLVVLLHELGLRMGLSGIAVEPVVDGPAVRETGEAKLGDKAPAEAVPVVIAVFLAGPNVPLVLMISLEAVTT